MAIGSESAPVEFADAARTTFIYPPVLTLVGAVFFGIGAAAESGFAFVIGGIAFVVAVGVGIMGAAGMIRSGQEMLTRHHRAAALAIDHYERAAREVVVNSPRREHEIDRVGAPRASTQPVDTSEESTPPVAVVPAASNGAEEQGGGEGATERVANVGTDPEALIALLNSLNILDATRNVQRLYGNATCASFINRKCEEHGMSGVNLKATDIPAKL